MIVLLFRMETKQLSFSYFELKLPIFRMDLSLPAHLVNSLRASSSTFTRLWRYFYYNGVSFPRVLVALLSRRHLWCYFFHASLSGVIYQASMHGVPPLVLVAGVTCRARGSRRWTCRWRAASWERRTQRDDPRPARESGRCGGSSRSGAETQQTRMCQFYPTLKACLRMMFAFAFASSVKNGFYGNK